MSIKRKLALVGATVLMALSSFSVLNADAYTVSNTGVGSFDWNTSYAKMTNKSNVYRMVDSCVAVYEDNTGNFVCNYPSTKVGAYDTYALATNNTYTSSMYNFKCWGNVYNSSVSSSGVAWFTGIKSLG